MEPLPSPAVAAARRLSERRPSDRRPSALSGRGSRHGSIDPSRLVRMDKYGFLSGSVSSSYVNDCIRLAELNTLEALMILMLCSSGQGISCSVCRSFHPKRVQKLTSRYAGSDEGPWNHSFRFEQCAPLSFRAKLLLTTIPVNLVPASKLSP